MRWEGCIAFILLFATCIDAQSTSAPTIREAKKLSDTNFTRNGIYGLERVVAPERLRDLALRLPKLLKKYFSYLYEEDLKQAKNAFKQWHDPAVIELEKRRRGQKIVCHDVFRKLAEDDLEILHGYKKIRYWRPKLLLLFQNVYNLRSNNTLWFDLLQNLSNTTSKCVVVGKMLDDMTLRSGTVADCLIDRHSDLTGFIFPEVLLKKFTVDIIFPSLDMFEPQQPPFGDQPETNKKTFEERFGWKAQTPIKLAIIFTRDYSPNYFDFTVPSWAEVRAMQASRWLKSLPEGEQIHILSVPDVMAHSQLQATGNEKDVAIALFGGDDIIVDSFALEYDLLAGTMDPLKIKDKSEFDEWKASVIRKSPINCQRLALLHLKYNHSNPTKYLRYFFGDDIPLIVLPGITLSRCSPSITIVSFCEHRKLQKH